MDWIENNQLPNSIIDESHFASELGNANYVAEVPYYNNQLFSISEEIPSEHSSDSGNYSPTTSSSFHQFDLENKTHSWPYINGENSLNISAHNSYNYQQQDADEFTDFPPSHQFFDPPTNISNDHNQSNNKYHFDDGLMKAPNHQHVPNYTNTLSSGYPETIFTEDVPTTSPQNSSKSILFLVEQPLPAKYVQPMERVYLSNPSQTQSGIIRPIQVKVETKVAIPAHHAIANKTVYAPVSSIHMNNFRAENLESDKEFIMKKEDRKMRNRAAAQLSRQRKKEETDKLKIEFDELSKKCDRLEIENKELKKRVHKLEQENHALLENKKPLKGSEKIYARPKMPAKTAGVCMLVLLGWMILPDFSTNENGTQFLLENKNLQITNGKLDKSHGRSLQSIDTNKIYNYGRKANLTTFSTSLMNGTNGLMTNTTNGCGSSNGRFPNETLSIKLSKDLFKWVSRHERMEPVQLLRGKLPPLIGNPLDQQMSSLPKLRINSSEFEAADNDENDTRKHNNSKELTRQSLSRGARKERSQQKRGGIISDKPRMIRRDLRQMFQLVEKNKSAMGSSTNQKLPLDAQQMAKLVKGIKSEEDNTLYVIPLNDYFLLPPSALDGNYTAKMLPKLSIILPALINSTSTINQLSMIRIECEIIGTNLFYLPEGLMNSLSKVKKQPPFE